MGRSNVVDNRCWVRTGHTLTQAGSLLLVFGGTILRDSSRSNEIFWMSTERMEWHLQMTYRDAPAPRDQHAAIFDATSNRSAAAAAAAFRKHFYGKITSSHMATRQPGVCLTRLIVFGGRNTAGKRLNDVWYLDVTTWKWHKPQVEGTPPSPRTGAAAVGVEGQMYIFTWDSAGRAHLNAWGPCMTLPCGCSWPCMHADHLSVLAPVGVVPAALLKAGCPACASVPPLWARSGFRV